MSEQQDSQDSQDGLTKFREGSEPLINDIRMFLSNAGRVAEVSIIASCLSAIGGYVGTVAIIGSPTAAIVGGGVGAVCYTVRAAQASLLSAEGRAKWMVHLRSATSSVLERLAKRAGGSAEPAAAPSEISDEERKALRKLALRETTIAASLGLTAWAGTAGIFGAKGLSLWSAYNIARITDLGGPAMRIFGVSQETIVDAYRIVGDSGLRGFYHDMFAAAPWVAGIAALAGAIATGRFAVRKAKQYADTLNSKHLRGAQQASKEELIKLVNTVDEEKGWYGASDLDWLGVPVGKGRLCYHFWVSGATGAGKSQAIHPILKYLRARDKSAVVYDLTLEFTAAYYREDRDFILNPFDQRFKGWSPFNELREVTDTDLLASLLLPIQKENDNTEEHFTGNAQQIFACILEQCIADGQPNIPYLCKMLWAQPTDLYERLKHTRCASAIDPSTTGQGTGGILNTMQRRLRVLRRLKDGPFSIRQFAWEANGGWLFLPNAKAYQAELRPLLAMAMQLVANAATDSRKIERPQPDVRLGIVADEGYSLGAAPMRAFEELAVEARQFGVSITFGTTNDAAVDALTDKNRARLFRAMFQNKIVMKQGDFESAKGASQLIGEHEIERVSRGISGGADNRDGTSKNWAHAKEDLVLPSELLSLPPNAGYLMLAGGYPLARVSWKPQSYPAVVPGLVAREDLAIDWSAKPVAQPADAAPAATSPAAAPAAKKRSVF